MNIYANAATERASSITEFLPSALNLRTGLSNDDYIVRSYNWLMNMWKSNSIYTVNYLHMKREKAQLQTRETESL